MPPKQVNLTVDAITKGHHYTGIGSRKTPENIQSLMVKIARHFAKEGMILRSGGAPGADSAFERGCDQVGGPKEIFLPWKNFQRNLSKLDKPLDEAFLLAKSIHPCWEKCSPTSKKFHARNIHQVLGKLLNHPSKFVIFWTQTQNQEVQGGTATAVNLAKSLEIPTFNLNEPEIKAYFEGLIQSPLTIKKKDSKIPRQKILSIMSQKNHQI